MKKAGTYRSNQKVFPAGKKFMAAMMMTLLLFLTCVNYFIYPPGQDKQKDAVAMEATGGEDGGDYANNPNPAGPDEKTPGNPASIVEEYIHHTDEQLDPFCFDEICVHKIAEAERLTIVHFERVSPPPEV